MSVFGSLLKFGGKGVVSIGADLLIGAVASKFGGQDSAMLAMSARNPRSFARQAALTLGMRMYSDYREGKDSEADQEAQAKEMEETIQGILAEKNGRRAKSRAAELRVANRAALEEVMTQRGAAHDTEFDDRLWTGVNKVFGTHFETTGAKANRRTEERIAQLQATEAMIDKSLPASTAKELKAARERLAQAGNAGGSEGSDGEEDEEEGKAGSRAAARKTPVSGRVGQGAARLINARSGAKDIARAAAVAMMETRQSHGGGGAAGPGESGTKNGLEAIHATMKQQHMEALGHLSRAQFTQRWPRR